MSVWQKKKKDSLGRRVQMEGSDFGLSLFVLVAAPLVLLLMYYLWFVIVCICSFSVEGCLFV